MSLNKDKLVVTLIAAAPHRLSVEALRDIEVGLSAFDPAVKTNWLAQGMAVDLYLDCKDSNAIREVVIGRLHGQPVDVIIQSDQGRRKKKLLVADMESTIIKQELLDELAKDLGVGNKVAEITRRSMNGEIDFAAALRERIALFSGQPVSWLQSKMPMISFMPGADTLLSTMGVAGVYAWLVTGGLRVYAKAVANRLGFDQFHANEVIVDGEILTGAVREPVLDRNTKRDLLFKACAEYHVTLADSVVIGDGANDLPMLQACQDAGGLAVAYYAKPVVRLSIQNQINYGDLTALLFAQGYSIENIISASRMGLQ